MLVSRKNPLPYSLSNCVYKNCGNFVTSYGETKPLLCSLLIYDFFLIVAFVLHLCELS